MIGKSIRSFARSIFFGLRIFLSTRPGLDNFAKRLVARLPLVDKRLRTALRAQRLHLKDVRARRIRADDLPPNAHQVYLDIKQALQEKA